MNNEACMDSGMDNKDEEEAQEEEGYIDEEENQSDKEYQYIMEDKMKDKYYYLVDSI